MNGWQFLASVTPSLAWLAAVFVLLWIFRRKIVELMPLLRLKYKDLEVGFRQAEEAIRPELPTPEEKNLAKVAPRNLALDERIDLKELVQASARDHLATGNPPANTKSGLRIGLIDPKASRL